MVIYVRLEKVMKNLKVQTFKAGVDLPTFNLINKKKNNQSFIAHTEL